MNDPVVAIAGVTAVLGLWGLMTGRRLAAWPGWILDGRGIRMVGAYNLLTSVPVIALALTHHDAIAFLVYAILSLVLVVTLQIRSNRRAAA
jgi:hypothetical protein